MSALLSTKFLIPPLPPALITRQRLQSRLDAGQQSKFMLVVAPAGYGKTTLLAAWARQRMSRGANIAWLSLDAIDNDPRRFWEHVIKGLEQGGVARFDPRSVAENDEFFITDSFLTMMINHLSAQRELDLTLVIDDYHRITQNTIHRGVAFLLEHLPPGMHLYIAGRKEPPIPLADLRAHHQLVELHGDDLRFRRVEAAEYLAQTVGAALSEPVISRLDERLGGWAAGYQLAAITIREFPDERSQLETIDSALHYIGDYLTEQVLGGLSLSVQRFLLETSILECMSGPLCDAITERTGSLEILRYLVAENLFTELIDEGGQWYRYHPMLKRFMYQRLTKEMPGPLIDLHLRAGRWLARQRFAQESIPHALAGGDFELATKMLSGLKDSIPYLNRIPQFLDWIQTLPAEIVNADAQLCLEHAWLLAMTGQLAPIENLLESAKLAQKQAAETASSKSLETPDLQLEIESELLRAFQAGFSLDVMPALEKVHRVKQRLPENQPSQRAMALVIEGHSHLLLGNSEAANQALLEAISLARASGNILGYLSAVHYLAQLRQRQGSLEIAQSLYRQAQVYLREQAGTVQAGIELIGSGCISFERNDLASARTEIMSGIRRAEAGGIAVFLRDGYLSAARLAIAQQEWGVAEEFLSKAEMLVQREQPGWEWELVKAWQARLWIARGDLDTAAYWAEQCGVKRANTTMPALRHFQDLVYARLLLEQGETGVAKRRLALLLESAALSGWVGLIAQAQVLLAQVYQASGEIARSKELLLVALAHARQSDWVRLFVNEGEPLRHLLLQLKIDGLNGLQGFMQRILASFQPDGAPDEPGLPGGALAESSAITLSERELQVLSLIELGHSYQDIANQLVIALSTVQTHVKNVYAKLDAHSGMEAVSKARQYNLIP